MVVQDLSYTVANSLQGLWGEAIPFVLNLVLALIVFVFGLMVAAILGAFVEKIFDAVNLDGFLASLGVEPYFQRAGMKLHASRFLGQVVNWFLIIAFLLASSDLLKLASFSQFLQQVLAYLPNVLIAAFIMLAAVVLANFLRKVITASVASARIHSANFLGMLSWWAIVVFGFLAALEQLQVAVSIIQTLITGLIAMMALAGGLAFGLGGKDYAAHLLGKLREQTERR